MQKHSFPISKSLDQFKSRYGSASGTAKPFSLSSRPPPSADSISSGSFANLKLTAEKLVKEQASVKTDLEIANVKLKKSSEHIHALEEKLQNAFNENAKLKVKQKEDEKLWKGLESKFSSTKTLCDQLTETLQQLASVVQNAEKDKEVLEKKLSASSEALDSLNKQMGDLSLKVDSAEEGIRTRDNELKEFKFVAEERERSHRDEQSRATNLIQEKALSYNDILSFSDIQEYKALVICSVFSNIEWKRLATKQSPIVLVTNGREGMARTSQPLSVVAAVPSLTYNMIKNLEEMLTTSRLATENLNSKLGEIHLQLKVKEGEIMHHITNQEKLEKEKSGLQLCNAELTQKHDISLQEIRDLEGSLQALAAHLVNLDKESLNLLSKFDEMASLYASCFKLAQQEKDALSMHAQNQYGELNNKFLTLALEKDAIQMTNDELSNRVAELEKVLESTVAQHAEECRLASERIRDLESEAETLISKKTEAEVLISKLEEKAGILLQSSTKSENQMVSNALQQGLLLKVSALEAEGKENMERLQAEILKKSEEADTFQNEIMKLEQHADSLDKEVSELRNVLEEKDQHILQCREQEKKLEDQIIENQSAAENKLSEARKQYDQMVENKQLEISRHLKEISLRTDQAINDIRKKYELEKTEIVNAEKDKVDKAIAETEGRCDQKLAECKEESRQQLIQIQEEHTALVTQIREEHDKKQQSLIAEHSKQLERAKRQAENELREKTTFLRSEHEAQIKALRTELEDECQKLEEELHLQKSREDRQRALLQLQWRVMSDKPKEDQEVNSKQVNLYCQSIFMCISLQSHILVNAALPQQVLKSSRNNFGLTLVIFRYAVASAIEYSIASSKRRSAIGDKRSHQHVTDSPYFEATQSPVPKLLKKVENVKPGSARSIPKHRKKVTRHEYEDPRKHKINTPKVNTPGSVVKNMKGGGHPRPSNIGDLFSEGSLNPYADDPYAFD
ncbi:hypothetical protein RIF29_16888 [Crotalaria pallida]|uniref:Uncharacterized protein n=1 Tax=Crotalaria pallida TaxID=3830 RepID=A0AAN9FI71_CROPI